MSLIPRNRIVNFRLTHEEYELLLAASRKHGSRCLADFARDAVMRHAKAAPNSAALEGRLDDLGWRLRRVVELLEPVATARNVQVD